MNDLGLLKPVCLFEQLFNQKLRLNDVPLDQFADFSCSTNVISTAVGSAMVSVGATRVLCGIKVKVLAYLPENTCPRFICNVDHLGLAHRGLRANAAPSKEDQSLAVQLEWLLGSVAVPDATKQLLIYPEDSDCAVATYLLHVDVAIIFDDGCLLDACLAACLAALASATWPRLVVASSDSQIASSAASSLKVQFKEKEESEVVNVVISEWPVALSFAVVPRPPPNAAHELICQPSRSESLLWDTDASTCHFVLNSAGEIIDFSMIGGFASCLWTLLEEASADKSSDIIEEAVQRAIKYLMTAKLYSVVRGKVVSIKEFGAFVSIEGSDRQGNSLAFYPSQFPRAAS
uniref:Ribosomal RNA-processing protein 42 n=2 Tax=Mesocestoides corti TaxID=53468 RepID=A0A5K3FKH5_MESCO